MKILLFTIILIFTSFLITCIKKDKTNPNPIEKIWRLNKTIEGIENYESAKDINDNYHGYQFLKNGELRVRQNISWCGTEPIMFETVIGSWTKTSDSTYKLEYPFWGGKFTQYILIGKISSSELQFKTINYEICPSTY